MKLEPQQNNGVEDEMPENNNDGKNDAKKRHCPSPSAEIEAKKACIKPLDSSSSSPSDGERPPTVTKPRKKKKKTLETILVQTLQPKNPVALLNEIRQGLVYTIESQTGPVHAPVFTMIVEVDGEKFEGQGRSKKLAKMAAAKAALKSFLESKGGGVRAGNPMEMDFGLQPGLIPSPAGVNLMDMCPSLAQVDFTSDDPIETNFIINEINRLRNSTLVNGKLVPLSGSGDKDSGVESPEAVPAPGSNAGSDSEQLNKSLSSDTEAMDTGNKHTPRTGVCDADFEKLFEKIQLSLDHYNNANLKLQRIVPNLSAVRAGKAVPEKGPVMLLYELFNDIKFDCSQLEGSQFSRFKMTVIIEDLTFEGTGPSKRLAKTAAAKSALATLCNISYSPMQTKMGSTMMPSDQLKSVQTASPDFDLNMCNELPQNFADGVGRLVRDKFAELMVGQDVYAKRKVLAGIVMTEGGQINTARVISVSTGTKCINGEHISIAGAVVNDCHAEIVSRRCLMVFLYHQLNLLLDPETASESIFETPAENSSIIELKPTIEFHLYINTAPCGDARIFSPHEDEPNVDGHPNRRARGQLRTKIESGEGTIPVKNSDGIQTWDGIIQGQRLLTMSCSDKVARWNVLGIQGSLLASLIKPIYLSSIVLGSLLHPAHMDRAVCGRIRNSLENLPAPYYLNRPKLAQITSSEQRNPQKAPNFSVNWTVGDEEIEVINSVTGKTMTGRISRLAKQEFLQRYMDLVHKIPARQHYPKRESEYGDLKLKVLDYQTAKASLFQAFTKEDLGSWLKKPVEQDQFCLNP